MLRMHVRSEDNKTGHYIWARGGGNKDKKRVKGSENVVGATDWWG
jgi:hypothetical protein